MMISKEILTDLREKFSKVNKALREDDCSAEPGESSRPLEKAYQTLEDSMQIVSNNITKVENNSPDYLLYELLQGYIYKELGRIDNIMGRDKTAFANLHEAMVYLKDRPLDPDVVIHSVSTKIELGLAASNANKNSEARKEFEEAEKIYKDFKATGKTPATINEVLSAADDIEKREGIVELGKLYTMTTYYLAQVLRKLEDTEKSAAYCHMTLKRQLEADDYTPIDWALNAATLSQYYLSPNRFTEARHHLAAATYLMLDYEKRMLVPDMTYDEEQVVREKFNHRFADIARCWTKYGLALLTASKERLMTDDDEAPKTPKKTGSWEFTTLKLPPYEVTDKFCLTFEDAKPIYHFLMKYIERSKEYYNAELEATEYTKIVKDEAEIYSLLAFFEDDPHVQCKYHKKRVDLYEHILSLLNPTYYLILCREAWYEAAVSYTTMMDTKLDILKASDDPTPHQRKKINSLAEKAIGHLQSLLSSFKDRAQIPEDEKHIYLCAYFYIGRLFYKIMTPDRKLQLKNLRNSYKYYDQFVLKCEENKEAGERLRGEVGVCKEMLGLLPVKIEKLMKEVEMSGDDD